MNAFILMVAIVNACFALRPALGIDTEGDLVPTWVFVVAATWGFGYLLWLA